MVYICDIDGTVANIAHRLHFIQKEPKDWDGFYKACVDDAPIPEVIRTVRALDSAGYMIVMISGRTEAIRHETHKWLRKFNVPCAGLYLRKDGDFREDCIIKAEILDSHLKLLGGDIIGVFEDRKQVVDMYRARGLLVFHVAEGNF